MAGAVLKIGNKFRALKLQTIGLETHSSWVEVIVHMIKRLATASGKDVLSWKKLHVPLALDQMLSPLGGKKTICPQQSFLIHMYGSSLHHL